MVKSSSGPGVRLHGTYAERLFGALIFAAVGLGLAGILFNLAPAPVTKPVVWSGSLEFNGERALATTTEFVTTFPTRCAGSPGKALSAQWIVDHLVELGYDPQVRAFGAWIGDRYYPDLANVWAMRQGRTAETVVVYGHYDLPAFVTEGAADAGSAVGALFELARVLADEPLERTIVFVFMDASEYGSVGADVFLRRKPFPEPIVAGVGLDFLNPGKLVGISVECPGTQKGYTPPWLRAAAEESATLEAGTVFAPDSLTEWIERSVAISPTDTGMFLRRRIPAVNLAGVPEDPAAERAIYHSAADTIARLTPEAMDMWGRTAERLLRTVAGLPEPTAAGTRTMVYLGLDGGRYLPGWAVRTIQLLVFAPLWGVVGLGWYWRRRALGPTLAVLRGEARRVLVLTGCLSVGLVTVKLAALFGLLPRYEMYPATAKDPVLYHPAILPLAVALLLTAAVVYLVRRYTLWLAPPLGADWVERHHSVITLLAVVVFATWLEGAGYAAVTFLALPAYLWLLLAEPAGGAMSPRRLLGGLLVIAGTAVFVTFAALGGQVLITGPFWWYIVLASTYGLFSLKASLVFLTVTVLHWEAFTGATGVNLGWVTPSTTGLGRGFRRFATRFSRGAGRWT